MVNEPKEELDDESADGAKDESGENDAGGEERGEGEDVDVVLVDESEE